MVVVCVDDGWIDRCDDRSVDGDNFVVVRNSKFERKLPTMALETGLPALQGNSVGCSYCRSRSSCIVP